MTNTTMIYTFLAFLLALTLTLTPGATQAVGLNPNSPREFLDAHNRARAAIPVPPLKWSYQLVQAATRLVKERTKVGCTMTADASKIYGSNQWSGTGNTTVPPRAAVDSWVTEGRYYDYASNACVAGHKCGVYKQVVWRNATELGCAQEHCVKEQTSLIICFYNPPGNYEGVKPY